MFLTANGEKRNLRPNQGFNMNPNPFQRYIILPVRPGFSRQELVSNFKKDGIQWGQKLAAL